MLRLTFGANALRYATKFGEDLHLKHEAEPADVGIEPEERLPAPEMVRLGIRNSIISGALPPGMQLRQDDIAAKYGTSRIPVREALKQLAVEGLVDFLPNRGAVVKIFSVTDLMEMMEIRIGLETRALRLAIPNMVDSDFASAAAILTSYDEEPRSEMWSQMNWQFHRSLYVPCNMPRLLALMELNWNHVSWFTRTQVSKAAGKEDPNREHWKILEACQGGTIDKAVSLLEQHILHTQKSIRSTMRRT